MLRAASGTINSENCLLEVLHITIDFPVFIAALNLEESELMFCFNSLRI